MIMPSTYSAMAWELKPPMLVRMIGFSQTPEPRSSKYCSMPAPMFCTQRSLGARATALWGRTNATMTSASAIASSIPSGSSSFSGGPASPACRACRRSTDS